jgi:DNA-binding NarL/FixJ family response regulator
MHHGHLSGPANIARDGGMARHLPMARPADEAALLPDASFPLHARPIRVVLADDHPLYLAGLEQLLKLAGDFEVVGRCNNGLETLATVEQLAPALLVVDLRMPDMDGLSVVRELRRRKIPVRIVLLTGTLSEHDLLESIRLGVSGAVLKGMEPRLLLQCLRKVHAGGTWVENRAVHAALEQALRREAGAREVAGRLTRREIDLVRMVAGGLRNKDIANRLCITEGTVKSHLHNIYRKLQLQTRVQVRKYAEEMGLI